MSLVRWHVVAGRGENVGDGRFCPVEQPLECRCPLDARGDLISLTAQRSDIEYLLGQFFRAGVDAAFLQREAKQVKEYWGHSVRDPC